MMTTITQREFDLAIRAAFDAGVSWARQNRSSVFDHNPIVATQKEATASAVAATYWNQLPPPSLPANEESPSEEKPKPLGGRRIIIERK
ncbi:MAG TPA: hypothetical protein VK805_15175 [Candidatus Baltobacteraceae bacterium]|jgi:hypothetical protein|nr:hypothetical protein [Candidatus Baltobacteraceae bacterium]